MIIDDVRRARDQARALWAAHEGRQATFASTLDERILRIARWAWLGDDGRGRGVDLAAVKSDILATAEALFWPPGNERPMLAEEQVGDREWPEALAPLIPLDTHLGRTLVAAIARWQIVTGRPVLPRNFAPLAGVDPSRVHDRIRSGALQAAPTMHGEGRPGRRVKGDEIRVRAGSALAYLKAHGRAPATARVERTKQS